MLPKLCLAFALLIGLSTSWLGFRQSSAFNLGQENQKNFWPRNNTRSSGVYVGGVWRPSPMRTYYMNYPGGGPRTGK